MATLKLARARDKSDREGYLQGTTGTDTITGTPGNDAISGDTNSDKLTGGDGDDTIDGGTGVHCLLVPPHTAGCMLLRCCDMQYNMKAVSYFLIARSPAFVFP
jgi:RTX calcium-binding nonapeptide repeat (4 copies)